MLKDSSAFAVARRKLTLWYLVIWAATIGFFTYLTLDAKESAYVRVYSVLDKAQPGGQQVREYSDRFEEFNQRFKERLIFFDVVLFIGGGWAAYLLAGKTLAPIARMVEEQTAFAADVSHSLRTPLTTIGLELEAYEQQKGKLPQALSELFVSIKEEIFSMTYLTEGLLALVRTGSDPLKSKHARFDLNQLVGSVIERMKPLAKAKGQSLKLRENQPASGWGNSEHIKQVLIILIDNAVKYSGAKTEIFVDVMKAKSFVTVTVEDNGKGIALEDQVRIFQRYVRGKEKVKGTGLGLSIANKIVEAHDGTIRLVSKPGAGSKFTVQLPRPET